MHDFSNDILFEDYSLLVLNKPAGVTVNRSDTTKGETVQDWAEQYLQLHRKQNISVDEKTVSRESNGGIQYDPVEAFYNRGGIVHRLDKETSGVLVIAKNPDSFAALQKQFKERLTKKTYIALAHGSVVPREGEVIAPVGRLPWNRKQFGIVAGGRDSVTKYKTISTFNFQISNSLKTILSLLELYPETGRTHQIRVHLKHIGYPIFADFLYAGRKTARDDRKYLDRVFLHAKELSLQHPLTGEFIVFSAPLPTELEDFLGKLERVE